MRTASLRPRILVPALATLVMIATMLGLGLWQLERKNWKEALIADLQTRLTAAPQPLPAAVNWLALDAQRDEFKRVQFSGLLRPSDVAFVYAAGSALRDDVSGVGYWVFAPVDLPSGESVIVNRGFIPQARKNDVLAQKERQQVTITGVLRWPEQRSLFAANDSPDQNLWFVRDHRVIAQTKGWPDAAPFYVEAEEILPATQGPRTARLKARLPNNHLGYAFTWFALAASLAVIFGLWVVRELKKGHMSPPRPSL